jgi:hypothetical protein
MGILSSKEVDHQIPTEDPKEIWNEQPSNSSRSLPLERGTSMQAMEFEEALHNCLKTQCPICGDFLAAKGCRDSHLRKMHNMQARISRLPTLEEYTAMETMIRKRLRNCPRDRCPICPEQFLCKANRDGHLKEKHLKWRRSYQCSHSGRNTVMEDMVRKGLRNCSPNRCPIWKKLFVNQIERDKHLGNCHRPKDYACPEDGCTRSFAAFRGLQRHAWPVHTLWLMEKT